MDAMRARPTPTVEDYLGAIYTLNRDQESVIGRRLADWLEGLSSDRHGHHSADDPRWVGYYGRR